jgi:IPT/TIG domain
MKRTFAFATLLGALVVVAALVSNTASAVNSAAPQVPSHISGVVPVIGKQLPGAGIPLTYHGGPVMTTNKTYTIFWKPPGYSFGAGYDTTINQYFTDVAADSGKTTNVYSTDTQYSSIQYSSSFGGSVTDTNGFPTSGCPLYEGDVTKCLTDAQLQTELDSVITNKGWMRNATNMFFIFTPIGVGSCFDSGGSECSYKVYCAYHGSSNSGAIYANQPYAKHAGCDEGQYPNGNDADPTINVVSHEHNEAITDPRLNAWYDAQGAENGDKCAWNFGAVSGPNGAEYNQTINNNHHYFLQMEWSNSGSTCLQKFSGGGGGGNPPQIFSFSPNSGRHGTLVTLSGRNFTGTTAVALVRGVSSYSASYSVLSSTSIRATVPTMPTGFARWKVTTPAGSTTSSGQFYVTG